MFCAVGHIFLVASEKCIVNKRNTAYPVSIAHVARGKALDIVFLAGKIPHEIAPVHPVELVAEEETDIIAHAGFFAIAQPQEFLVISSMALVVAGVPYAGEPHHVILGIRWF